MSASSAAESTKALLDAAAAFLWSEGMQSEFDDFVSTHAHAFIGATADGEQQLRWQEVYVEYMQLYEARLEQFVAAQDCSLEEFVAACRDALLNSAWQEHRGLATCILSMSEYDYFLRTMAAAAEDASSGPASYDADLTRGPVVIDEDSAASKDPGDGNLDGDFM